MPAIPAHRTPTADTAWDGPANEKRLRLDQNYAYYRRAYAWRDPEGDESTKAAYRFIHHEVDAEGEPGAANLRGCVTGIAVLNGARGGTTIPEDDYAGVYRHLAAHLRDAEVQPPELKRLLRSLTEYRAYPVEGLELRAEPEDQRPRLVGHAAVFDQLTDTLDCWGFRERIARGAFRKTIKEADVRALWNHDPTYVLGRTKNGTLLLKEDARGLAVTIIPPDTQWARDFTESIRRGDVDQMSFGFRVVKETREGTVEEPVRVIQEVQLFDVSPVTFPAYPATDVQVRSLLHALQHYLASEPPAEHPAEPPREGPDPAAPLSSGHSPPTPAPTVASTAGRLVRLRLELDLAHKRDRGGKKHE